MRFLERGRFFSYLIATVGSAMLALGVSMVYEPLSMVTGGFAGVSIVVKKVTGFLYGGIPVWITTTVLNIPIFIWAIRQKGFVYVKHTIYAAGCFSLFLSIFPSISLIGEDYLMAAILGGAISGTGLALVFSQGMTTGGSDLLSSLIQHRIPHVSVASLLLYIDSIIVIIGMSVFGIKTGLYSIIAVFITTKVMDGILEGLKYAKMVQIISKEGNQIAERIMSEAKRGVTSIAIKGMYTGEMKNMLLCIVSRKEVISLIRMVESIDQNAFVMVSDVREVKGEGFINRS